MKMQSHKTIKQRIKFYYENKEKCHIRKNGDGFIDGYIRSDVIDDLFILVENLSGKTKRLFVNEIFDINDFV